MGADWILFVDGEGDAWTAWLHRTELGHVNVVFMMGFEAVEPDALHP